MAKEKGKMKEKTMEAKTATLLKHMLDMELERLRESIGADIVLFIGVDGRIFASSLPDEMNSKQFYMFNLVKAMLSSICAQLQSENLRVSIQQYPEGTLFISGVGKNAFLVSVLTGDRDIEKTVQLVTEPIKASDVMLHIFEQRSMDPEYLAGLPSEVSEELQVLSRQLFVEQFDQTRGYKKNMKVQDWLRKKIAEAVGLGSVEEIMTIMFNEMGTTAPYMNDGLWRVMTEKIIQEHIRKLRGDIFSEEVYKTWMPELEQMLKSFV
ncbi:MAG: hypothetical protein QCI38_06120 [Candidatus Thermoplasmatota archaeon]|nr:hypothetical protein [Candidatus Thermoplasmatota archaeon]